MKQHMERRSRPFIALYLALIVMLAFTPIVGLADDPTPGPTDTPTETAVPIDTVVPPATEAPTETSTPEQVATNTPAPEAETPVPTETLPDLPAPTAVVPATLTSVNFEAEADSVVSDDISSADTNYGSEKSLNVAENPQREGLIRFSVTGLQGGVVSATLRLHITNGSNKGPAIYSAASGWDESSVTWNSRPERTGTSVDNGDTVSTGDVAEYDVTSLIGGNGTFTFNLAPQSTDDLTFVSRESTDVSLRPVLVVTSDESLPTATPTMTPTITATPVDGQTATPALDLTATVTPTGTTPPFQADALVTLSRLAASGSATGGKYITIRAELSGPAPAGGATVQLSSNSSLIPVPSTILVPAGATQQTITVKTVPTRTTTAVTIAARYGGRDPDADCYCQGAGPQQHVCSVEDPRRR